jgi:hypothetical protein
MREVRIDLKAMLCWLAGKWKALALGGILCIAVMTALLFGNEVLSYRISVSQLYPLEQVEEVLTDGEKQNVKMVIAIDDVIQYKKDRIELLQSEAGSEERFLEEEELLNEVDDLTNLKGSYTYYFSDYQNRYYYIMSGKTDEEYGYVFPTLTKKLLFLGIIMGIVVTFAVAVLLYLVGGHVHSAEEIELNFHKKALCVRAKAKDIGEQTKVLLDGGSWTQAGSVAIIADMDWTDAVNERVAAAVSEYTKAVQAPHFMDSAKDLDAVKKAGNAILVLRVNESKLRSVDAILEKCKLLRVEVRDVLLITE